MTNKSWFGSASLVKGGDTSGLYVCDEVRMGEVNDRWSELGATRFLSDVS